MPSFLTKCFSSAPSRLWQQLLPAGLVLLLPAAAWCQARPSAVPTAGNSTRLISAVPMAFEENDGQLASGLAYMGRAQSYSVGIERDGLSFFMPDSTIGVRFAGSHGGSPVSLSSVAYRSNYFIGSDPSHWHEGVANYSRVGVRGIYPGIDTEFYEKNGELEHDFVLAPGTDAKEMRLDLRSAHHAALRANGDAVIPVANGELCFRKPVAYQFDSQGRRIAVDASYQLSGHNLRFDLGSYDRSRTLVIDPVIVFATYVAGTAGSTPAQMATDGTGATLFLTGTTTSITGFPASSTSTNHSGSGSNVFVAALATSQLGSALKWITFLGNSSTSTATSIAYTAGSQATLYVGGTTGASGFPGTPTGTIHATDPGSFGGSFPAGGGVSGFVTSLAPADGTAPVSTYVSTLGASAPSASGSDSTTVSGVAEDSSGNVYIAGYGPGTKLPLTANALGGTSILPNPATGAENAFVIELNAKLNTASLVTYLQSTSAVAANYEATAVQVDGSGNIYVAGTAGGTSVAFPTAQSFSATNGHYDDTKDFSHCTRGGTNTSAFLAQIKPATHDTLSFSMFTCADTTSGSETARGFALGANGIYLVGDTLSPDLPTGGISYSNSSTTKTAASPTTGLQAAFATGNTNGYVIHVPISSGVGGAPDAFTFLGGTSAGGNTTIYAAALDSTSNLVQLAGQTAATRATMPGVGAPGLPESGGSTQDQSGDNKRAFLYTFEDVTSPAPLSAAALKSISYLGNGTTGSQAVSVQPDAAGAGAFVLVQDTVGASGFSYTSADAAGTAAPSKTNAYLADIQGTNVAASTPGVTLASATSAVVDPGGSSPVSCGAAGQPACTIAYDPTDPTNVSTIEYTWTLSTSAEASNVVLNFPPFPELASPYTLDLGGVPNSTCASSTASNGLTCSIATLAAASSYTLKLTGKASASDSPTATPTSLVGQAFQIAGTAADAEGEYQVNAPAQPTVTVANPIKLTLAFIQSPGTVDAANGTADTGSANHTTEVTYTATVKNTSAYDSPSNSLTIAPPGTAAFYVIPGSVTATVNGAAVACKTDGTGCTGIDIPANGTLVYSFKALYLAASLSPTVPGPTAETLTASAQAASLAPGGIPAPVSVTTQVNGYAALTITVTPPCYPGGPVVNCNTVTPTTYTNSATAFNLGATGLTYVVTVNNAGPNAVNNLPLANVLPRGWRSASSSPVTTTVSGGATANCTSSTACSMNLPNGGKVTITLSGGFFDTTTPDTAPVAAVSSTQSNNPNITDQASITVPAGTYNPNATSVTSTAITVQRLTHLVFALASSGTAAVGVPAGTNYNLSNTNKVSYNYSIQNQGPDIAINVAVANTFTPAAYPGFQSSFVQQSTVPAGVTCSPATAPAFSNCTIASLAPTTGTPDSVSLPYLFPDNPPANTYPVTAEVSAVPIAASSAAYTYGTVYGTVALPAYGNSVDSNSTGTINGDSKAATNFTIYRSNHLVLTLANTGTASKSGASPAGYDLGPNVVTYAYTLVNQGPNYAINVPLADTLKITTPSTYTPPANAYSITAPSAPNAPVVCSAAPLFQSCGIAGLAPTNAATSPFSVTVTYPDNPITLPLTTPGAQDVSAIPSNINSAVYNYSSYLNGAYGNAINTNPGDTAPGNSAAQPVNSPTYLYRTASISINTTPTNPNPTGPGSNCAGGKSPCLYMVNSTNFQDTAQYAVSIVNNGPDMATQAQITYALPAHFIQGASVLAGINSANLNCTPSAGSNVCTGYIPVGTTAVTLTSQFDSNTVPQDAAFTDTNTPPNTPGSAQTLGNPATSVSFAFGAAQGPSNLPTVNVDRATHLVTVKMVGPAPGDVSPTTVAAVNLDEKTAADAQGKNDLVQVTLQVGNAGLNDAFTVSVTDPLPPFFILTQKPVNCSVPNGTPVDAFGNPMTGATPVTLTCTIATVPAGTGTAGTSGHHGTVSGAFAQIVYGGKFQDNGLQPGIISFCAGGGVQCSASPNPQAIAVYLFGNAKAQSQDGIDLGDIASAGDSTSAATPPLPIQRAAHLHFTVTQYVQPGDTVLNPVGGVTGPGIAEAQFGANGGEVINPVRYQVQVTNDGPNIATDPIVSTTLPLNPGGGATKFVNVAQGVEPSSVSGFPTVPSGCASGMACQDAGMIATGASILYNVDGNFDINTLTEGNSGARTFASVVASSSVIDSNPTATAAGAQQTSLPITVVNTPAGANYTLAPLAGNLSQPVQLKLTTVQVAGITGLAVGGSTAPAVPMGASPNPPDNGKTVPLYRFGQGGVYYALGTTAGIPTATSNQTQVCLNSIPDVFQKPERVLLWALSNAPAGTAFGTVPHFTNTATEGDITTMVVPQGGGNYSVPTSSQVYPATAQPQPAMVCGVVNGLASATTPTVLAVLEPVNFAPYIRTQVTAANSTNSQPGKGVTASAAQVDLTISPQNNYDYNDADPCYTGTGGTTRSACNDNVQLTTFLFGGGNLIGDAAQQHSYSYQDLQQTPKPQFNLPAGSPQLYLVLVDQLGAQGYKNVNTSNPSAPLGCDPGNPSTAYTPSTPACPLSPPLQGSAPAVPPLQAQFPLNGGNPAEVALLIGNVGFGGSAGLIPLPQTPTPEATANVTAGQTAGFVWNWLTEQPAVQAMGSNAPPVLTLTCASADGTDLASKGITCNVQPTYTYSTGSGNTYAITAPPAIYVVTTANTAVGALHEGPLDRELHIIAAVVFPIGAIPLVILLRRRRALKLSSWLAVMFFASLIGIGIGCGSNSSFKNQGGTTSTATPAGTYQFVVTATGTDSSGNAIDIKTYPFAVTVSAVK